MGGHAEAVTARHLGGDRLELSVRGHRLVSDQPLDGGGEDSGPTPTELFVAGLAGCVAFYAERFLTRRRLPTAGLAVRVEYEWASEPSRVAEIRVRVEAPGLPAEMRPAFERVIEHCPVHNTLGRPPHVGFEVSSTTGAAA